MLDRSNQTAPLRKVDSSHAVSTGGEAPQSAPASDIDNLAELTAARTGLASALGSHVTQKLYAAAWPDWVDTAQICQGRTGTIIKLQPSRAADREEVKALEKDLSPFFDGQLQLIITGLSSHNSPSDVLSQAKLRVRGQEARHIGHVLEKSCPAGVELYQMRFCGVRAGAKLQKVGVLQVYSEPQDQSALDAWSRYLERRLDVDLHILPSAKIEALDLTHLSTLTLDHSAKTQRPEDAISAHKITTGHNRGGVVLSRFFIDGSWQDLLQADFHKQAELLLRLKYTTDLIVPLPAQRDYDESMFRQNVPQFAWGHVTEHTKQGELVGEWIGRVRVKCDQLFVGEEFRHALEDRLHPKRPLFEAILVGTRILQTHAPGNGISKITARNAAGAIVSAATRDSYAAIATLSSNMGLDILYRVWRPFEKEALRGLIAAARARGFDVAKRDFQDSRRLAHLRAHIGALDPELDRRIEAAYQGPSFSLINLGHIGEGRAAFTTLKLRREAGRANQQVLNRNGIGSGVSTQPELPSVIEGS
ncbi:hypothetical protein OAO01_06805 [Oligoflexia bacterium]|nr:hypothetical protein [Oligoflexia bacterium]